MEKVVETLNKVSDATTEDLKVLQCILALATSTPYLHATPLARVCDIGILSGFYCFFLLNGYYLIEYSNLLANADDTGVHHGCHRNSHAASDHYGCVRAGHQGRFAIRVDQATMTRVALK